MLDVATGPRPQDPSPHLFLFFANNRAPPLHPLGLEIVSTLLQMASQLKPSFFSTPAEKPGPCNSQARTGLWVKTASER